MGGCRRRKSYAPYHGIEDDSIRKQLFTPYLPAGGVNHHHHGSKEKAKYE